MMDNMRNEFINEDTLDCIPAWNSPQNPTDFFVHYSSSVVKLIVDEIEKCNVFFSSPLDIDYSMICSFPDIFCVKDEAYGERGPFEGKEDEEDEDIIKREATLIKAVLKKGNIGKRFEFGSDWERNFLWYRYRFLSNKSKPASHVRMFTKLEELHTSQEILEKLPSELTRLMERIIELSEQVIE
ncbi:hypothetical protein [Aliivibrio sp. SR45-2]|uniref:hypothetical protein n=2 Tax=Aliivibrio sp. SR45-2 TaxID=2760931 RepID=UPI002106C8F7|nr:hypothetical protein [Aliivibrio sp. SR45-2]